MQLPAFIALVGHPKAGKSTAAELLEEAFGTVTVDDGYTLRKFAVEELGLTWDDVMTQEGKSRSTQILGVEWQHRKILGELGNHLEAMFGDHILPLIATRRHIAGQTWVFPSCRKTQGRFYRARGGIVIQIDNPLAGVSDNDFDVWDERAVDYRLLNDGLARGLTAIEARHDLLVKLMNALHHHERLMAGPFGDEEIAA